jgi:hypothetical protein
VGTDSAGNVYGLATIGNTAYNVIKLNANGSSLWTKSITTNRMSWSSDLAVDSSGNTFLGGEFKGTVDFDPGAKKYNVSTPGTQSGFVLKLNSSGNFQWVTPIASQWSNSEYGRSGATSVALDGSGNVIAGGWYKGSNDFNPGSGTTTLPTIGGGFVTKLNSSGGLVWARAFEVAQHDIGLQTVYGLAVDSSGAIYVTGNFTNTIDLDPGVGTQIATSNGGSDIYVVKLSASGNYVWATTVGGTHGGDVASGIAVDSTGTVHVAGTYGASVDFDPDPISTYTLSATGTGRDMFLLKLQQS